jgi:hypothetical protein
LSPDARTTGLWLPALAAAEEPNIGLAFTADYPPSDRSDVNRLNLAEAFGGQEGFA